MSSLQQYLPFFFFFFPLKRKYQNLEIILKNTQEEVIDLSLAQIQKYEAPSVNRNHSQQPVTLSRYTRWKMKY